MMMITFDDMPSFAGVTSVTVKAPDDAGLSEPDMAYFSALSADRHHEGARRLANILGENRTILPLFKRILDHWGGQAVGYEADVALKKAATPIPLIGCDGADAAGADCIGIDEIRRRTAGGYFIKSAKTHATAYQWKVIQGKIKLAR